MGSGKEKAFSAATRRQEDLLTRIKGDTTITEETRTDLLGQITGFQESFQGTFNKDQDNKLGGKEKKAVGADLDVIAKQLEEAQQGKGVFGQRQQRRDFVMARIDRPGLSKQTR